MGKSFTREDGLMIDSSAIALDANGTSLQNGFLHKSTTLNAASVVVNDSRITTAHRVCNATFGTPSALISDVTWTTANGSVTFACSLASGKTTIINYDLILFNT